MNTPQCGRAGNLFGFAPATRVAGGNSAWHGLENSLAKTELPHYAVNAQAPEDAFYTDRAIARRCVERFNDTCKKHGLELSGYTFIEPSVGEGCFFDFLPEDKIGLDIAPRAKDRRVETADFLTWRPRQRGKYVVVGNPPFGHRGAIALAFVKRALLFADAVGFILPMSFYSNGKGSNMRRVEGAALIHSEKLPAESFYQPDTGAPVSVNTVFQVWSKKSLNGKAGVFTDYDVGEYADIYTCCTAPNRFCGLGRGRVYDCFIAATFYKTVGIVYDFDEVLYGSGYGLVIKKRKRDILRLLEGADWGEYCSAATNHCKHIRMHHIRRLLGENGFGVEKALDNAAGANA